jgi:hypothetical protein
MKANYLFPWGVAGVAATVIAVLGAAKAEPPAVPQAYFEATVSQNDKVVSKPHALVKLGAEAKLSFGGAAAGSPRLRLTYKVEEKPPGGLVATINATVAGRQVATGTIPFTKDHGAATTLEGGGYSWHVTVEYLTAEQLRRKTSAAPPPNQRT